MANYSYSNQYYGDDDGDESISSGSADNIARRSSPGIGRSGGVPYQYSDDSGGMMGDEQRFNDGDDDDGMHHMMLTGNDGMGGGDNIMTINSPTFLGGGGTTVSCADFFACHK